MLNLTFGQTPDAPLVSENEWPQTDLMVKSCKKKTKHFKFLELQCSVVLQDRNEPLQVNRYVPAQDGPCSAQMNQWEEAVHEQGGSVNWKQCFGSSFLVWTPVMQHTFFREIHPGWRHQLAILKEIPPPNIFQLRQVEGGGSPSISWNISSSGCFSCKVEHMITKMRQRVKMLLPVQMDNKVTKVIKC